MTRLSVVAIVALIALAVGSPSGAEDLNRWPAPSSYDPNKMVVQDLTPEQIAKIRSLGYEVIRQGKIFLIVMPPVTERDFVFSPPPSQPGYTLP